VERWICSSQRPSVVPHVMRSSVTQSPNQVLLGHQVGFERSAQSLLADDATGSAGLCKQFTSTIFATPTRPCCFELVYL
jgi:hypothetical protein